VRLKRGNSGFIPALTERKAHNTPVSGGATVNIQGGIIESRLSKLLLIKQDYAKMEMFFPGTCHFIVLKHTPGHVVLIIN